MMSQSPVSRNWFPSKIKNETRTKPARTRLEVPPATAIALANVVHLKERYNPPKRLHTFGTVTTPQRRLHHDQFLIVTVNLKRFEECCSVLQCVAVCCSVLQCAVVFDRFIHFNRDSLARAGRAGSCAVLQCSVCCSVKRVAGCCSMLQRVAVVDGCMYSHS